MMGKAAFLFPIQISRYPGMDKNAHDAFSCGHQILIKAGMARGLCRSSLVKKLAPPALNLSLKSIQGIEALASGVLDATM
jgi:hypothetical protein